jgi:serine/threonine-protein kinase
MGRSGEAYLAEDRDLPSRPPCFVKRFQYPGDNGFNRPLAHKLFDLQGEILNRLGQHPQIPSMLAKFEEQGEMYLVREYIDGELLSKELNSDSRWTQTQVFDFLMDMAGILSFIHSFKYIHQDINPQNIIHRASDGRFMLIGFSTIKDIANVWHQIPDRDPDRAKVAIGTPGYIPYEQEQNVSQFNSDIYATGVIAIQALTGLFPIPRDARTYELQWRDRVSDINLRLINIIDKMVRPDYRNRYQSAAEILKDLEAFAITQIPPSKFDRLKPHLVFGAAVGSILLGFTGIKLMSSASADKSPIPIEINSNNSISGASSTIQTNPSIAVNQSPSTWQSYTDPGTGIKIKYYPTWQLQENRNLLTGENALLISPRQSDTDKYLENVSIGVETLTNEQTSLAEYTKSTIEEINKFYQGAKIIESTPVKLAKNPANLIVFTGQDEQGLLVKNLQVFMVKNGKSYTITYKAENNQYYAFLQTVMTMINSFELTSDR